MDTVEAVARTLCWKNGMDPDATLGGDGENFLWHEYREQAQAVLDLLIEAGWTPPSQEREGNG